MKASSLPLAYLVSQYPTTNHTYLLREIRGLRAAGWDVAVLSIRGPDRPASGLTGEELSEFQSTFYVLGGGLPLRPARICGCCSPGRRAT